MLDAGPGVWQDRWRGEKMELESQVVVVSVFGRGHWLAADIAQKGIPVLLLDVSSQMGPWKSEDAFGPFGFFQSEGLSQLQMEKLMSDGDADPAGQGLTLWLKSGPFELRGPVTKHRARALHIPDEVMDYVAGKNSGAGLRKLSFQQNWLAHLSHQFLSTTYALAPEAMGSSRRSPLFANYFIRRIENKPMEQNLKSGFEWCRSLGVRVVPGELLDLAFADGKTLNGFEIKTDQVQILKMKQVVWCLSGEETLKLGKKIQEQLFPHGVVEPEWVWVRYQVRIKDLNSQSVLTRTQIPASSLLIEDVMLPWTHENYIVLQKTSEKDRLNAWIRIPAQQRFQKQYLEEHGQGVLRVLGDRIHDNEVVIHELPSEAQSTFGEMGPSRFPIYARHVAGQVKRKSLSNIFWDGPECWVTYHAEGVFEKQGQIAKELSQWWTRQEELRKKREEKQRLKEEKRNEL
jgi:hypothetical protein